MTNVPKDDLLLIKDNILEQLKYNEAICEDIANKYQSALKPENVINANSYILLRILKYLEDTQK